MEENTSGVDDVAEVVDELEALGRKLMEVKRSVVGEILKAGVELTVGRKTGMAKGLYGSQEANLGGREGRMTRTMDPRDIPCDEHLGSCGWC